MVDIYGGLVWLRPDTLFTDDTGLNVESRLNAKHEANERPRPTHGACVAVVRMGDVDTCDGSRIDRPHYAGHCSNRPHRRASIHVKKQMHRYELGF